MLFSPSQIHQMIHLEAAEPVSQSACNRDLLARCHPAQGCAGRKLFRYMQRSTEMFHELILAIAFIAIVAAPAIVTASPGQDKRDRL